MLDTISLQGKEYALVPVRLKAFREENPRASIKATPHWRDDGSLDFETEIIRDQSDENSARGNGWAHYSAAELKNPKAYEKLQTISKGRALADIGYLNNGQVATTEEMLEFADYKEQQFNELMEEIKTATKREEFSAILAKMNPAQKQVAAPIVNQRIKELKDASNASAS